MRCKGRLFTFGFINIELSVSAARAKCKKNCDFAKKVAALIYLKTLCIVLFIEAIKLAKEVRVWVVVTVFERKYNWFSSFHGCMFDEVIFRIFCC